MLRISIEEPLTPNEYLYEVQDREVVIELGSANSSYVNRYVFGWWGDAEDTQEVLRSILDQIWEQVGKSCFLIDIWEDEFSSDSRIRSLLRKTQRQREGWEVIHQDNLYIATKEDSPAGLFRNSLRNCFMGDLKDISLWNRNTKTTLEYALHKSAPSKTFIKWLGEKSLTFMYRVRSNTLDNMLVVITPIKIDLQPIKEKVPVVGEDKTSNLRYVWNTGG